MKRTMMQTIKLIHARYGVYLLQDLIRRNIGTYTVENRCKDLCTNLSARRRVTLVRKVMTWKLIDAKRCLRKEQFNNKEEWKKSKIIIVEAGILHDFEGIWNLEQERVRNRKVNLLKRKYGQPKETHSQLEGITIANREIPATFTSDPKCHGGYSVDKKEKKFLSLLPKFAVYNSVDVQQCSDKIQINKRKTD